MSNYLEDGKGRKGERSIRGWNKLNETENGRKKEF